MGVTGRRAIRARALGAARIDVRIDELVFHGLTQEDGLSAADAFASAIERELLADRRLDAGKADSTIERLAIADVVVPERSASLIGDRVGSSLSASLRRGSAG